MTATFAAEADVLRDLRDEYNVIRTTTPRGSHEAREAFERLFRASCAAGHPLDALRRHATNEVERFFSNTVEGTDGHVYWDGARNSFKRNDGKTRIPRRWWYAHIHGKELGQYEDLVPTCGELHCINPEHCTVGRGLRRTRFTLDQMLGSLQVAALRLGRSPKSKEWDTLGLSPTRTLYQMRFGNWENALKQAGLQPAPVTHKADAESCIAAIKFVRDRLGYWPTRNEFMQHGAALRQAGLTSSKGPILKYLGRWDVAIAKAKKS
jgi:hypothetical protein